MIGPIKKLFKGKYFLELDESQSTSEQDTAPTPIVEEKTEPEPAPAVETEPVVETEAAKPKVEKSSKKKAEPKVKAPEPVASSSPSPLELIRAAVQKPTSQAETNSTSSEPTFAPDYLLYTKTQAKRRPGACMSSFLEMARQRR